MKQFYKVLLITLFVLGSCFNAFSVGINSSTVLKTPVQTINMNVGDVYLFKPTTNWSSIVNGTTYSYNYSAHNREWNVIGDQIVILDPKEVSIGEQIAGNGFTYSDWKSVLNGSVAFYAVKPGRCTVVEVIYYHNNESLYPANLSKILVQKVEITVSGTTGTDPQSMVMQHQLHLGVGQEHTLSPRLLPTGTSSTLTWYSSNTNVATVSGGKITAVAVGDATITCITANGLREDCEVTVTPTMVSNLSLNQDQLQMSIGDTYQFSTAIAPENATYKQVTWTSMNPDVVSVDNNGLMSCLSNGWSVILATTADGSNLTAGCFVQVGASEGGDVNGDGKINIDDVTDLIDRLLNLRSGNSASNEGSLDDLIS